MAGHSKWANIQHRKGRQDEKRGKVWTRIIREIMVAARQGGGDPGMNPRLRLAIDKAKAANMPADTVKKNVDKATGNLEGVSYEEIRYEGYGIGGAAIIVVHASAVPFCPRNPGGATPTIVNEYLSNSIVFPIA